MFFIIALLFLVCVHLLNVPVVSCLRIIMYDCVCMIILMHFAASAYQTIMIGTLAACSLAIAGHQKCVDCGPVSGRM